MDQFSVKDKVTIITGASKGIGLALARGFAAAGSHVALCYKSDRAAVEHAAAFSARYGVTCRAYCFASEDDAAIAAAVGQIRADYGAVDIAIANAGESWARGPMIDAGVEEGKRHLRVNLQGTYALAHAAGQIFKAQGNGSLILTTSMSAHIVNTPRLQAAYNAGKAGMLHLSKSLAVEWAAFARVNCVSPGYIATELYNTVPQSFRDEVNARTPMRRPGQPDELLGAYLFFASEASSFATGSELIIDGGYVLL